MATQNGPTNLLHWRIQGSARDALSKFFHFHAVFGKKFAKYYVFIVFIPLSGVAPPPPPSGKSRICHCIICLISPEKILHDNEIKLG